ncbi:L,D-transpeptidase family protein [Candidatus Parcubacteria bacterium]|nr:L,D-transpeptidase family protein [Candidatus Parcubacteria bacterium]
MKKFGIVFTLSIFFISACFYLASFFIPRTAMVETIPDIYAGDLVNLTVNQEEPERNSVYLKTIPDLKKDFILEKKDFLEINLDKMEVRVYQKGEIIKQVEIYKKGNVDSWGGTASGHYEVLRKIRTAWSAVSEVYMPYALHFYGKYYIHGESYYPNGSKLISSVSGGCIRLLDKDAKEIYGLVDKGMAVLVIDKENSKYEHQPSEELPSIMAKSWLAADLGSGFVFGSASSTEQYSIASLTKLMTAITVVEKISLDKTIWASKQMLEAYGSTEKLTAGSRYGVVELLYPFLIESSNDAGEILAGYLGRENTIALMNEKAEAILMEKTDFACPSGFDLNNISTSQDLFQLARYIFNNRPPLLAISKGESVPIFGSNRFKNEGLWNKNLFTSDPNFVGGKTGYLPEIKNNGLFIFRFLDENEEEKNIVIVVLNSKDSKGDTQKIYRWLMENYSLSPAVPINEQE